MINILETLIDQLWDDRYWGLALTSDNPQKTYADIREKVAATKRGTKLEELPAEQQAWYRST